MGFGIWQLLVIVALVCAIVGFRMVRARRIHRAGAGESPPGGGDADAGGRD